MKYSLISLFVFVLSRNRYAYQRIKAYADLPVIQTGDSADK